SKLCRILIGLRWLDQQTDDVGRAYLDAFAVEVASVEISQIDLRLAVHHAQHAAIAVRDAYVATYAVARIDRQHHLQWHQRARILPGEIHNRRRHFSRIFALERRIELRERRLALDFDRPGSTQAIHRLIAGVAGLQLLELFQVF